MTHSKDISSVCVDVNLLCDPKLRCLPNKPNFPQPTSASVLIPVPKVLQNQALQSVSWLCCISRHFVRSAADTSLLSTCTQLFMHHPKSPQQRPRRRKKQHQIMWYYGHYFCFPLLQVCGDSRAALEETLSSTSCRDQKIGVTTKNYWSSQVSCTLVGKLFVFKKYLILATHLNLVTEFSDLAIW